MFTQRQHRFRCTSRKMVRLKPAVGEDYLSILLERVKNTTCTSKQPLLQQRYPAHQQKNGNNPLALFHRTALRESCTDFSQPSEHPDQNKNRSSVNETADLTGDVLSRETCSGSGGGSRVCSLDRVSRPSFLEMMSIFLRWQ